MAPKSYPREELEEMVQRWIEGNQEAERLGDWTILSKFYTSDAIYRWNMGPNQEFQVTGRQDIADIALGYHMKGFEDWKYPYYDTIIDEKRGTVVCFYHHIGPGIRPDGTSLYSVDGCCGSWFEYGGNYEWKWQRDFFDLGNIKSLTFEMAGANLLNPTIKRKIHEQAKGQLLPGTHRLRDEPSFCTKVNNFLAMLRIVAFGT